MVLESQIPYKIVNFFLIGNGKPNVDDFLAEVLESQLPYNIVNLLF